MPQKLSLERRVTPWRKQNFAPQRWTHRAKAEIGQVVSAGQRVFVLAHDGPRDAVFNVNEWCSATNP